MTPRHVQKLVFTSLLTLSIPILAAAQTKPGLKKPAPKPQTPKSQVLVPVGTNLKIRIPFLH